MTDERQEPVYTKPTAQVDLEERLANKNRSPLALTRSVNPGDKKPDSAPYATEDTDTSGYIGTDPVYQNYADETHRPIPADDSPETAVVDAIDKSYALGKTAEVKQDTEPAQTDSSTQPPSTATGTGSRGVPAGPTSASPTEAQGKPEPQTDSPASTGESGGTTTVRPSAATTSVVGSGAGEPSGSTA